MVSASVAFNADNRLLNACLPLFQDEQIQSLEWSYDCLLNPLDVPDWFHQLISAYSREKKLYLHGVQFNPCSAKWHGFQSQLLKQLKHLSAEYSIQHLTEHFGVSTSMHLHEGAPIETAYSKIQENILVDRFNRLADAAQCPVGIENLAFTFSENSIYRQLDFLTKVVDRTSGFLLIDLHNLYCQAINFNLPFDEILSTLPTDLIGEIHISGGQTVLSETEPDSKVRRDTHDHKVPEQVFEACREISRKCPHLQTVCLEYVPKAFTTSQIIADFQTDYKKLLALVNKLNTEVDTQPKPFTQQELVNPPLQSFELEHEQHALATALIHSKEFRLESDFIQSLSKEWYAEEWSPKMIETASILAKTYQNKLNQV